MNTQRGDQSSVGKTGSRFFNLHPLQLCITDSYKADCCGAYLLPVLAIRINCFIHTFFVVLM